MSDLSGMSDEDRRTVLKARFDEMAMEFLNSDAGAKWFDEKVKAMAEAAKGSRQPQQQQSGEPASPRPQGQHPSGNSRVSAFEKFLLGR